MLEAQELARLQRAADGLSSEESEPSSPCDFFREREEETQGVFVEAASCEEAADAAADAAASAADTTGPVHQEEESFVGKTGQPAAALSASDDEEEFNIHSVLKQGRRQRRQQERQQEQQGSEKASQPVALPAADVALDEAAQRVQQQQARREKEAASRAARQLAADIQHVSSAGPRDPSQRPPKKQQQVYVGLPVGVGWHVPLVGVEGRGGYKTSPSGEEAAKKKSPSEGEWNTAEAPADCEGEGEVEKEEGAVVACNLEA
ncbi:hypothetical protein Efla_002024 [Eimeria flavescens]